MIGRPGFAELEAAIVALGRDVAYPENVDVVAAVRNRLLAEPARRPNVVVQLRRRVEAARGARPVLRPAWRGVAVAAAVIVLLFVAVLGVSPTARHAVADFLGLRGVKVEVVPSLPPSLSAPPLGSGLDLGQRVTLEEAQAQVPYLILLPTAAGLGRPDEVYLTNAATGQPQVFLVYRARPGLPTAPSTGAGLLVSEFQARIDEELIEKKVLGPGTTLEPADVNGRTGIWIAGRPHFVMVVDSDGNVVEDQIRLAGNVLLWERGSLTLRLEGALTKEQAIRIAGSFE